MISNFQFTSPVLTNLDFKINESFNEDNEIKISVRVETNVSKNTSKPEAIVRVNVLIGSSDVSMPFYLKPYRSDHYMVAVFLSHSKS